MKGGMEGKLGLIQQELSLGIHSMQEKIHHLQVRLTVYLVLAYKRPVERLCIYSTNSSLENMLTL